MGVEMLRSLIAVLAVALALPAAAQPVHVAQGHIEGVQDKTATAYLGLPFAAAPVGGLRWAPPAPAASWTGTRKADRFGADCQQTLTPDGLGPWTPEYLPAGPVSEDCLYLNVWTPKSATQKKLPVLVWLHGGAFTGGSGSVPIYNGAGLANEGIIVVTLNYRLGVYGFLSHQSLAAESGVSGNYGLQDQIAALQWVKDNIAAFGGDPSRVTVAGQSAGAAAVHALLASPKATGLFSQAVAQSGSGMGLRFADRSAADQTGKALVTAAGVKSIADLRRLSPTDLDALVQKSGLAFRPIIDGVVLPGTAAINDVPILTGMTANETSSQSFFQADTLTPASYRSTIEATYVPLADEVLRLYPAGTTDAEARASRDNLARDRGLAAMAFWAEDRLKTSRQPIYAYLWTHIEPGPEAARYRAFHSSEIPYVFGTLDAADRPFTEVDHAISKRMMAAWVNWVSHGNPNGLGKTEWQPFTSDTPMITALDKVAAPRPVLSPETIALFRAHAARGGGLGLF
jgi:para-nitrobenzyl esterase